jgi:hypothetical protein
MLTMLTMLTTFSSCPSVACSRGCDSICSTVCSTSAAWELLYRFVVCSFVVGSLSVGSNGGVIKIQVIGVGFNGGVIGVIESSYWGWIQWRCYWGWKGVEGQKVTANKSE